MNSPACFRVLSLAFLIGAGLGIAGCGDSPRAPTDDLPVPKADPGPSAKVDSTSTGSDPNVVNTGPFRRSFEGIAFTVPKGWQETKLAAAQSGFIDARFLVPSEKGTIEITCLSNEGGLDENISRWIGQFQTGPGGQRQKAIDVDGAKARWIDLEGTFNGASSGKPGPHPEWRMIGVGIPLQGRDFFLKLNGPSAAVKEVEETFREFVESGKLRG